MTSSDKSHYIISKFLSVIKKTKKERGSTLDNLYDAYILAITVQDIFCDYEQGYFIKHNHNHNEGPIEVLFHLVANVFSD